MIMAVLSVTCRFSKNMATKKVFYQIPDCYLTTVIKEKGVQ